MKGQTAEECYVIAEKTLNTMKDFLSHLPASMQFPPRRPVPKEAPTGDFQRTLIQATTYNGSSRYTTDISNFGKCEKHPLRFRHLYKVKKAIPSSQVEWDFDVPEKHDDPETLSAADQEWQRARARAALWAKKSSSSQSLQIEEREVDWERLDDEIIEKIRSKFGRRHYAPMPPWLPPNPLYTNCVEQK